MENLQPVFYFLLLVVAFLYSSVGHGGASGYLAVMGLMNADPAIMKPTALMLNIMVSLIAFIQYRRTAVFKSRMFIYLVVASVPTAFIGARITLDAVIYERILGCILLVPAIRLTGYFKIKHESTSLPGWWILIACGGVIGLLSGIIGIGGGILLSPLLIFMGWVTVKETALLSALFIFVNSLAGIAGLLTEDLEIAGNPYLYKMAGIVLIGALAGSWMGSKKFSNISLKRLLGVVMLIAGIKLILQ